MQRNANTWIKFSLFRTLSNVSKNRTLSSIIITLTRREVKQVPGVSVFAKRFSTTSCFNVCLSEALNPRSAPKAFCHYSVLKPHIRCLTDTLAEAYIDSLSQFEISLKLFHCIFFLLFIQWSFAVPKQNSSERATKLPTKDNYSLSILYTNLNISALKFLLEKLWRSLGNSTLIEYLFLHKRYTQHRENKKLASGIRGD